MSETAETARAYFTTSVRFTLDVAYVGNRSTNVQTQFNENAATQIGAPASAPTIEQWRSRRKLTWWALA